VLDLIAHEGVDVHPEHLQVLVDLVERQDQLVKDNRDEATIDAGIQALHQQGQEQREKS
jgi:hypothetical protein